jgi:hypothetical protein
LTQVDLSLGRRFAVTERIALQFRTDAFNLFNHPNFANPLSFIGSGATFLSSPSMANQGLGSEDGNGIRCCPRLGSPSIFCGFRAALTFS